MKIELSRPSRDFNLVLSWTSRAEPGSYSFLPTLLNSINWFGVIVRCPMPRLRSMTFFLTRQIWNATSRSLVRKCVTWSNVQPQTCAIALTLTLTCSFLFACIFYKTYNIKIKSSKLFTYKWWNSIEVFTICYLLELKITIIFLDSVMNTSIYITSKSLFVFFIYFGGVCRFFSEIISEIQRIDNSIFVALWSQKLSETGPYSHAQLLSTVNLVLWATLLTHHIRSTIRL